MEAYWYFSYADETVYKVQVSRKGKESPPKWCRDKTPFNSTSAFSRVVGNNLVPVKHTDEGFKTIEVVKTGMVSWVLDDDRNNRLIELSIHHRDDVRQNDNKFLSSFSNQIDPKGKLIGSGATQVLGDPATAETTASASSANETSGPFKVVHKPPARYTDEAKENDIQGSVIVKITLLSNGSVGTVSVVKSLSYGLTEQAVRAARQIVFLPKKAKGVNASVIVTRDYAFSIY